MPRGPAIFRGPAGPRPLGLQSIYEKYNNFNQFKLKPSENYLTNFSLRTRSLWGNGYYYVRKKVTFSTPSPVTPHCNLQCGIIPAAEVGLGQQPLHTRTAQDYPTIGKLLRTDRQADSQTVRDRDIRTNGQTEGGACVGMAVASRGDFSSLCNPIPFQCED